MVPLARHTLPIRTLAPAPMDKAQCVPYEWATLGENWKIGQRSPSERFMHVLEGDRPGTLLTLKFTGTQVGCYEVSGQDIGAIQFSVDGRPWATGTSFESGADAVAHPRAQMLATDLQPGIAHTLQLRVADTIPRGSRGRYVRIGWLLVDGEVADPLARADPLVRIDAVYADMKPIQYSPPPLPERWRHLERTIACLREGPELKIVMLGDSIIGDTSSSRYELLLQRLYPKCTIIKQTSVRGSTGCWWYKHDNRVEEYVLQYKPDLLIIGGISQRGDVESIREVIRQVRAKQSPEILLMTPAFGALGDPHVKKWTFEIDRSNGDYRGQLGRLAEEERCGFLDLTGPWWRYVQESGRDYG